MNAFAVLAMFVALAAFLGLLLHLRWDPIGAARMGALPLDDASAAAGAPTTTTLEATRER